MQRQRQKMKAAANAAVRWQNHECDNFIKNEFNSELQQASDYLPAAVVKFKIVDLVVKLFV
jgi:hypothetical protein